MNLARRSANNKTKTFFFLQGGESGKGVANISNIQIYSNSLCSRSREKFCYTNNKIVHHISLNAFDGLWFISF